MAKIHTFFDVGWFFFTKKGVFCVECWGYGLFWCGGEGNALREILNLIQPAMTRGCVFFKFAEFAEFAVEKMGTGNANYALRVKPAMTRECVFLKFAEFAEFAVEKDFQFLIQFFYKFFYSNNIYFREIDLF